MQGDIVPSFCFLWVRACHLWTITQCTLDLRCGLWWPQIAVGHRNCSGDRKQCTQDPVSRNNARGVSVNLSLFTDMHKNCIQRLFSVTPKLLWTRSYNYARVRTTSPALQNSSVVPTRLCITESGSSCVPVYGSAFASNLSWLVHVVGRELYIRFRIGGYLGCSM